MKKVTVYLDDEKYKNLRSYVLQEAMRNGKNPSMSRVINGAIDLLLASHKPKEDPPSLPDSKPTTEHRENNAIWAQYADMMNE